MTLYCPLYTVCARNFSGPDPSVMHAMKTRAIEARSRMLPTDGMAGTDTAWQRSSPSSCSPPPPPCGLPHGHRTVSTESDSCAPRDANASAECACAVSNRCGGRAGGLGARLARRGRTCCSCAAYGLVRLGEGARLLDGFISSNTRPAACGSRSLCQPWAGAAVEWHAGASHSPGSDMDRSAGALSEHLEARSELLLFTRLELAAAQGTVGKLSTSAFRWRRQREPSEASLAIPTAMDHVGKIVFHGKIPKLTDTH